MTTTALAALTDVAERARAVASELMAAAAASHPDDVLAAIAEVESVGRLVDAARISAIASVAENSDLAGDLGFASPTDAVATTARISTSAARSRVRVAAAIRRDRSMVGAELEAKRPVLAQAITLGQVGVDAAMVIVRELDDVARRVDKAQQAAAEEVMVALATGVDVETATLLPPVSVDYLTIELRQIISAIDPDGARPREERALRMRKLHIGRVTSDGGCPVGGYLMPEIAEQIRAFDEASRRSPRFTSDEEIDASTVGTAIDDRTPGQRMHDSLAALVIAGSEAQDAPTLNGSPVTVIVTVDAKDLNAPEIETRDGDPIGTMAGPDLPVSRAEVLRYMDSAGYRVVTLDHGRIVSVSSQQRCFPFSHRLAVAARDGYRCFVPGCTAPRTALQMHHVVPYRAGGATHADNAILLCYWHHRIVDTGPWKYRISKGVPQVRGPGIPEWTCRPPNRTRTRHSAA
ncbi:hypothetical protein M2152_002295 [Microbacteriaceae bacterium SG_E_30_P1]|uniref:HNH nuclease domain-containing protein n=1 Tax=Antiquaquibacter oligotrophicus TaxID=2880260 RepID=A0ABT6KQ74_9MICO|nr:HNH endonuclease signature motif containing protein [Antiquaquibacter oligotrophicus]MDH6182113.1 hypothetical protein [Antiquaquibacter oligotrophicus]UDF12224.1 HNH endonuclease [Antiquaquibacter oligotrophicus]